MMQFSPRLILAERLTLAVLLSGVASLALSDFVSPFYWGLVVTASLLRLWFGPAFSLSEMQASMIGWAGFVWIGIELVMGRALIVSFTDFLLILSLAVVVEAATPRNHLHRILVGFFLILGAAVLTDSVLYIVPLITFVLFVWRASHCLYGMQLPGGDLQMGRWRSDLPAMLALAAVAGMLFTVLPRFDFRTYLKPVQPRMQTSGFSDRVELGDFARTLDATVVLRIEPLGADIEAFRQQMSHRYWRGVVLSQFNGTGWERVRASVVRRWRKGRDINITGKQSGILFAVYRDASDHNYLIVPDGIAGILDIPAAIWAGNQGVFRFVNAPERRLRIVMRVGKEASVPWLSPPDAADSDLSQVPAVVGRWAREVTGDASKPGEIVQHLVTELSGWDYDLDAPIDKADPISSFLNIRRGHCELYASALALALRTRGIPARVVNGYFGGEWNEVGGFYLIRRQHAHSWTEAWIDGSWQRFDATPPSRWQLSGVRFPALDEIWESITLSWYRYVLAFQNSDRVVAIKSLFVLLKTWWPWLLAVVIAVGALFIFRRTGIVLPKLAIRLGVSDCLDRWLRLRGIERRPYQPFRHLPVPQGVSGVKWQAFIRAWEMQAYGGSGRWNRRDLMRHLRAL